VGVSSFDETGWLGLFITAPHQDDGKRVTVLRDPLD
jgi:hypothetical protein